MRSGPLVRSRLRAAPLAFGASYEASRDRRGRSSSTIRPNRPAACVPAACTCAAVATACHRLRTRRRRRDVLGATHCHSRSEATRLSSRCTSDQSPYHRRPRSSCTRKPSRRRRHPRVPWPWHRRAQGPSTRRLSSRHRRHSRRRRRRHSPNSCTLSSHQHRSSTKPRCAPTPGAGCRRSPARRWRYR